MEHEPSNHKSETVELPGDAIARKKLEKLADPKTLFGIRFMNRGEYEKICKEGKPTAREVCVPSYAGKHVSFDDYMANATKNWNWKVHNQTLWGDLTLWARDGEFQLRYMMNEAHKSAQKTVDTHASTIGFTLERMLRLTQRLNVRDEMIKEFRARLLKLCGSGKTSWVPHDFPLPSVVRAGWTSIGNMHEADALRKKLGDEAANHVLEMIDALPRSESQGYESMKQIEEWVRHNSPPDTRMSSIMQTVEELFEIRQTMLRTEERDAPVRNFLKGTAIPSKEELRSILSTILYAEGLQGQERPYHLALVVGKEAIGIQGKLDHWHIIRGEKEDHPEYLGDPAHGVLGAISLFGDRGMIEDMAHMSNNSGAMAHPIFDKRGRVRYPKK